VPLTQLFFLSISAGFGGIAGRKAARGETSVAIGRSRRSVVSWRLYARLSTFTPAE
jgi:hypothetical protein